MDRRSICRLLVLSTSVAGCATAPQVKYATDPRSGEVIEYSKASDGSTWLERNPIIGVTADAAKLAAEGVLMGAAVIAMCAGLGLQQTHGTYTDSYLGTSELPN